MAILVDSLLRSLAREHLDELDALGELRESVVLSPDWVLADLAEHDHRAEAHLDGLRLAGPIAIELAAAALTGEEPFAAAAAVQLLAEQPDAALTQLLGESFVSGKPEMRNGIRIGLCHATLSNTEALLRRLVIHDQPAVALAACDILSFHRQLLLQVPCPMGEDRCLLFRVLGRRRAVTDWGLVAETLAGGDAVSQWAALCAAALSGMDGIAWRCRAAAKRAAPGREAAVAFLGVLGDPSDCGLLLDLTHSAETLRAAIRGLGALGRSAGVPRLVELMEHKEADVSASAAEAFRRVTGVRVAVLKPDAVRVAPVDGQEEADDKPPVPDAEEARRSWVRLQSYLGPHSRWCLGQLAPRRLADPVFEMLALRDRYESYLSLAAARTPGLPDIEFLSHAERQSEMARR